MSGIATAVIGGAIISGVVGAKGSRDATSAQVESSGAAIEEQRRQFDATEARLLEEQTFERARQAEFNQQAQADFDQFQRPFLQAGVDASGQQRALVGLDGVEAQTGALNLINESPGQKFLRDRGQKNLLRNSAAIGGLGGGNVREALVQQGVGFAQQDIQNQFGRLGQIAGQGQAAPTGAGLDQRALGNAAQIGQFGAQSSGNIQNALLASGNARASGIIGQNNAFQSALGGAFTGLAQSGAFSGGGFGGGTTLPAVNTNPFARTV
jgi:hypothetical protein